MRQFDAALTVPQTADPVADLLVIGAAYRRYAIERPHMYRLMFGSTSAHGINAPAHNVLTLTVAEIERAPPQLRARGARRCTGAMMAGRISVDRRRRCVVVATAAQFWALIHGFVMLELAGYYGDDGAAVGPVLASMTMNLLSLWAIRPSGCNQSALSAIAWVSRRNAPGNHGSGSLRRSRE